MNVHEFLNELKSAKSTLSVENGVVHFEDGRSFDTAEEPKAAYMLIQEGGASSELYLHGWDSRHEADQNRVECANGSYRTTPVFEVPEDLALHPDFHATVENILAALAGLDYPS